MLHSCLNCGGVFISKEGLTDHWGTCPNDKLQVTHQFIPHKDIEPHEVTHPSHYNWLPGIECMDVVKWFNFCKGNAIKYIWRAGRKGDSKELEIKDLQKAIQNLEWEIKRLEKE